MNNASFALRRSAIPAITLALGLVLAACSTSTESSAPPATDGGDGGTGSGTVTVADGAVTITASGLQFDATTIEATAGEDFTITLVNNDSAPHNISIYSEEGGDDLVMGGTAEAGQTVTVDVSALEPGTYYFQCDIHPDMNGQVVVSG